jgi:non-ribosomal peptide synthetase-like protein
MIAAIAVAKWIVLRKPSAGVVSVYGSGYVRKWFVDRLINFTRTFLLPVYATLYTPALMRLLGAKIGLRCEISTVSNITPDFLHVGDESFLADGAMIGGMRIFGGRAQIGINSIGSRTFVGNSAVLPVNAKLGSDTLIGVVSLPPPGESAPPDGSNWLGSPPFRLPRLQPAAHFDEKFVYRPTKSMVAARLCTDAIRILFPITIAIVQIQLFVLLLLHWNGNLPSASAIGALATLGLEIAGAFCVIALKWMLMGRYRPVVVPLWSRYVWCNEIVNGAFEAIFAPALASLIGTPWLPMFLRCIGCKIGRGTYLATTLFSEFDLVEIGDFAALNLGATIQTHLFEDRVMKSSHLRIGRGCGVGNMAVVLYDTQMEAGSRLAPLSLLMKGESLRGRRAWTGIPIDAGWQSADENQEPSVAGQPSRASGLKAQRAGKKNGQSKRSISRSIARPAQRK